MGRSPLPRMAISHDAPPPCRDAAWTAPGVRRPGRCMSGTASVTRCAALAARRSGDRGALHSGTWRPLRLEGARPPRAGDGTELTDALARRPGRDGPDGHGGEAVRGSRRHGAGAPLPLDPDRPAVRVRCGRWLGIPEDVVEQRQQGAESFTGCLEHMFVRVGRGPDGTEGYARVFAHGRVGPSGAQRGPDVELGPDAVHDRRGELRGAGVAAQVGRLGARGDRLQRPLVDGP